MDVGMKIGPSRGERAGFLADGNGMVVFGLEVGG